MCKLFSRTCSACASSSSTSAHCENTSNRALASARVMASTRRTTASNCTSTGGLSACQAYKFNTWPDA